MKILVVAAYKNELKPLCDMGRKHFVLQDSIGFLAAGIGPVAASFGLTHCLKDHLPDQIIAIGTAGIINDKDHSIGDIVLAKSVSCQSGSLDSYTIPAQKRITTSLGDIEKKYSSTKAKAFLKDWIKKFPPVNVFSPQEITKSNQLQKILLQKNHDAENLESYAFHFVAKKFNLPLIHMLGLTNRIGPQAHREWKENEALLCHRLAKKIVVPFLNIASQP